MVHQYPKGDTERDVETGKQSPEDSGKTGRCRCSIRKLIQVLTGFILLVLMTGCLVGNKLSLIWLLGGTPINTERIETWYAAFGLILIVPEAFALVKVFWHTSFIKRTRTHKWPSGVALFVGFLVSFAEASSYLVFTLEVAPRLPVHIILPLMSAVFSLELSYDQWAKMRFAKNCESEVKYDNNFTLSSKSHGSSGNGELHSQRRRTNWKRIILTILGFSGVWATCAISGIIAMVTPLPWFQALCLPATMTLLALCWHPTVQTYMVRSPDGSFGGRWKATCVYTVLKLIVLIVGLSIIMVVRLKENGILDKNFFKKLWEGLQGCEQVEFFYPLLLHFGSSFFAHLLGFVAGTLCLPIVGITVPFILCTPTVVGLVLYACFLNPEWLDELMCLHEGIGVWCACGIAVFVWLAPLCIRHKDLNKSAKIYLKPYNELFIQPAWNGLFLEQHMILNYTSEGFSADICPNKDTLPTRIFLCTTMYREADFEMGRLLKSLRKISKSQKLKTIYLEAHIFLDNGTSNMHLTDFASQLISLLESSVGVTAKEANAYMTPYGVQLNWDLPNGLPFFIHLKDTVKIKAKKRWSQVMYMSYVLNYRTFRSQSRVFLRRADSSIDDSMFVGFVTEKEWEKNSAAVTSSSEVDMESVAAFPMGEDGRPSADATDYMVGRAEDLGISRRSHNMKSLRRKRSNIAVVTSQNKNVGDRMSSHASLTSVSSLIHSIGDELFQVPISSDQGIGVSDDISESSQSWPNEDADSFDGIHSAQNSMHQRRDDGGQEYEGDVSSANENSLTFSKARKITNRVRDAAHDNHSTIYEYSPPPYPPRTKHHRSPRHRRPTPVPTRHKYPRNKKEHKLNPFKNKSPQRQNSTNSLKGMDNLAYISESPSGTHTPQPYNEKEDSKDTIALPPQSPTTPVENGCDFFTIHRETVPPTACFPAERSSTVDEHTYILATDADMEFDEDSVIDLLNLCSHDQRVGGACGRTHPIGRKTGPLVWYQKFEYAKDFWMIKSAQNVIGSVMCCPGCFSLYRAAAVRDVLPYYAGPTCHPFDAFVKDTGEDRWMCTLMMLHGWKLEYTAFCDNATYCPDNFKEFMTQRRRWVLSDMANMLLVFKNIFNLARKNDSFSIAYILYMIQMFTIVLLSPASTVVILAGGLDIVYGIPYEILSPLLSVIILTYALICIIGSPSLQKHITLALTILLGITMLVVVIGGSIYVANDIMQDIGRGLTAFQQYYLILLLIAALVFAAVIHPLETWIIGHGVSYLLGFPGMQILLPVYAICNIVDQSWGTREDNQSRSPPISCFSKNRKKYHKSLSKNSKITGQNPTEAPPGDEKPTDTTVECTTNQFRQMNTGPHSLIEEFTFWEHMCKYVLGRDINLGLRGEELAKGLRTLRNICLCSLIVLNGLWLALLSALYFNADVNVARLNVYGLIAGVVYGLVLFIQLVGMTFHRIHAVFTKFARAVFGKNVPVWIHIRTA